MPKEEDLHGAALALIRLQDTYNLNMTDMAAGSILDSPAFVQMTGKWSTDNLMHYLAAWKDDQTHCHVFTQVL